MSVRIDNMSEAGDLGRRIVARRNELHLTVDRVAELAGMAPGYVEYIEQNPTANPSVEALANLSRALQLSTPDLLGGLEGRAPGGQPATRDPRLVVLDRSDCEALIRTGGIGRAVFRADGRPMALPVNFKMCEGDVVFRSTEHGAVSDIEPREPVSFEVDRIDEVMSEGWSVLAGGTMHRVTDPPQLVQIEALGIEPWAGGARSAYFCIQITSLTGRKIEAVA
jgi:hypothetical protein